MYLIWVDVAAGCYYRSVLLPLHSARASLRFCALLLPFCRRHRSAANRPTVRHLLQPILPAGVLSAGNCACHSFLGQLFRRLWFVCNNRRRAVGVCFAGTQRNVEHILPETVPGSIPRLAYLGTALNNTVWSSPDGT